jgi:hypothetical protein
LVTPADGGPIEQCDHPDGKPLMIEFVADAGLDTPRSPTAGDRARLLPAALDERRRRGVRRRR